MISWTIFGAYFLLASAATALVQAAVRNDEPRRAIHDGVQFFIWMVVGIAFLSAIVQLLMRVFVG